MLHCTWIVENEWTLYRDSENYFCTIHRQLNTLCMNRLLFIDSRFHYLWSSCQIQLIRWIHQISKPISKKCDCCGFLKLDIKGSVWMIGSQIAVWRSLYGLWPFVWTKQWLSFSKSHSGLKHQSTFHLKLLQHKLTNYEWSSKRYLRQGSWWYLENVGSWEWSTNEFHSSRFTGDRYICATTSFSFV